MARLEDAEELCTQVHRVLDQLAIREAMVAGTIRVSSELVRKVERVRKDNERFFRLKAEGVEL